MIDFAMFREHHIWSGNVKNAITNHVLFDMVFTRPDQYTGIIHDDLAQDDNWDHCTITMHECTFEELRNVLAEVETSLATYVTRILEECRLFYPQLELSPQDVITISRGDSYSTLMMLMSKIPPQTPWSEVRSIGNLNAEGNNIRRAPTLSEVWNMRVGFPIIYEALRRNIVATLDSAERRATSTGRFIGGF
jgi:hypothetical protein